MNCKNLSILLYQNIIFYEIDRSEIWDWIAMILFDQIFVPGKIRGDPYRYVVNINDFFTSFRHLIRGPCWAENHLNSTKKILKIFTHQSHISKMTG